MARIDPARASDHPGRALHRRKKLPGGRAVVGGLLVAAAALGVFAASAGADDPPATSWVVVTAPVAPGHRLDATDLQLVAIELPSATAALSFGSIDEAIGAVTLAPLEGGELLARSSVLAVDGDTGTLEPSAEFSFAIERERAVDGSLQAGELVDVLATYGTTGDGYTRVVSRGARVTAIASAGSESLSSPGTLVLTLALAESDDVLALTHATEVAAIRVVRTTRADPDAPLPDQYQPDEFQPDEFQPDEFQPDEFQPDEFQADAPRSSEGSS